MLASSSLYNDGTRLIKTRHVYLQLFEKMHGRSTYLIFVGRIERNLADFRISFAKTDDTANGQFNTLEQRRFGCVTVAFSARKTQPSI